MFEEILFSPKFIIKTKEASTLKGGIVKAHILLTESVSLSNNHVLFEISSNVKIFKLRWTIKNMAKRGIVFYILIALGIIVVLGILAFFIFAPKKLSKEDVLKEPEKSLEACKNLQDRKQIDCYRFVAETLKTENPDIAVQACLLMGDENEKKGCLDDLVYAQTNQNKAIEICNSMKEDVRFREHCYNEIMSKFGEIGTETQLVMCDSKSGMDKDNCYRRIAESFIATEPQKSVDICNKISDVSTRDGCLNQILSNPEIIRANVNFAMSVCDKLTLKSRCFMYVADSMTGTDPKQAAQVCQKLTDEGDRMNCFGMTWLNSNGLVMNDLDFSISLCDTLKVKRDDCLRRLVAVFIDTDRKKAAEICKLMSSSASSQCLLEVSRG